MIKMGLIGFGYWGPNILRNFISNPNFQVVAVAEMNEARRQKVAAIDPKIKLTSNAEDILKDPEIEAVAIVTPVGTHFTLAKQALMNRKHVLVEKPMCTSTAEAQELVSLAAKAGLTLMVDHTFLMTGAVKQIKKVCESGELGKICSYDSMRINLGLFQQDVNVLWDLAPHDFSILNYLINEDPIDIEANGYSHLRSHLPDMVYLTMHFPSHAVAHFNMSWMSPVKVRRVSISGTQKMLVWDDLSPDEKIKIHYCGITQKPENRDSLIPEYRLGDILSPRVPTVEALQNIVQHFAEVIQKKTAPIMDGKEGLRVVNMLEMAQRSLDKTLARINQKLEEVTCLNES